MRRLENKVAIVTGAARGIGRTIVGTLCKEGATVYGFDIDKEGLHETVSIIQRLYKQRCVHYNRVDITKSIDVNNAVNKIINKEGKIDILVNNAGILSTHENILTVTDEIWDREIMVDLTGAFYCCRAILQNMIDNHYGKIISISSLAGDTGRIQTSPAYAAAKAGIYGLTMSLAKSVAKHGINVNAVCPGVIRTDIFDSYSPDIEERLFAEIPYIRNGEPQDIANAVLFLASNESSYITGARIRVNGGSWMG